MNDDSAVHADIQRAYAHDSEGREHDAIRYYDRAWQQGVPESERRQFLVGYGSTLRNVGRADEAVGILSQAVTDDPSYAPFQAFLALALFSSGHPAAAIATMLGVALDHAPDALGRYQRALTEYHAELLTTALRQTKPIE
jgi:tetratricopeptide (TPR) repeat protein